METIIMPCSINSVHIFSANEMSLFSTLVIVSLIPVIWLVSLPFRGLILSCLTFRPSFSLLILFLMSSRMPSSYSELFLISESLHFPSLCVLPAEPLSPSPPWASPWCLLAPCPDPKAQIKDVWTSHPVGCPTVWLSPLCFSLHSS